MKKEDVVIIKMIQTKKFRHFFGRILALTLAVSLLPIPSVIPGAASAQQTF